MKHIKKKFRFEKQLSDSEMIEFQNNHQTFKVSEVNRLNPKSVAKCFLFTESNHAIEAFLMNFNGKQVYIPEPNPTLIYFNNAYFQNKEIDKLKKELNSLFQSDNYLNEDLKHKLYHYFGMCCGFITFLFSSIESMMNQVIPNDYEFKQKKSNKTEVFNKDQIQRHISFDDKLKLVLTDILGKSFSKSHPSQYVHITNLKEFRDNIIHTKMDEKDHTPYAQIFKRSFTFKYNDTLLAVRELINFYEPNLIEECQCGKDF